MAGDAYNRYLRSPHWRKMRRLYRESDLPQHCACGTTVGIELHHLTYKRIGHERLEDLAPMCGPCHKEIHGIKLRSVDPFVPNDVGRGELKPWDTASLRLTEPGKELKRRQEKAARRAQH